MDIQAMVDGWSAQMMRERADTQMTLGDLIACVEKLPVTQMIHGLHKPHSYRGYYSDLAFEAGDKRPAGETLAMLRECMGKQFSGYKGGDYHMHAGTPCWQAEYGCCGMRIVGFKSGGEFALADDD